MSRAPMSSACVVVSQASWPRDAKSGVPMNPWFGTATTSSTRAAKPAPRVRARDWRLDAGFAARQGAQGCGVQSASNRGAARHRAARAFAAAQQERTIVDERDGLVVATGVHLGAKVAGLDVAVHIARAVHSLQRFRHERAQLEPVVEA